MLESACARAGRRFGRSVSLRRLLAFLLLAGMVGLVSLAYASPPDPLMKASVGRRRRFRDLLGRWGRLGEHEWPF
jgi:hypothetical protein